MHLTVFTKKNKDILQCANSELPSYLQFIKAMKIDRDMVARLSKIMNNFDVFIELLFIICLSTR